MSKKAKLAVTIVALVTVSGLLLVHDATKGLVLSTWYRPKVASNFKHDFDDINPRLSNDYGIHFDDRDKRKDCGPTSGYPSGGKSIFTCGIRVRANPVIADQTFIEKWRKTSPSLEQYLLAKGWQKEWNRAQPIDEILNNFNDSNSIGVNYSKKHDKTSCQLTFVWLMPETPNHLTVDETCEATQRTWGW